MFIVKPVFLWRSHWHRTKIYQINQVSWCDKLCMFPCYSIQLTVVEEQGCSSLSTLPSSSSSGGRGQLSGALFTSTNTGKRIGIWSESHIISQCHSSRCYWCSVQVITPFTGFYEELLCSLAMYNQYTDRERGRQALRHCSNIFSLVIIMKKRIYYDI